MAELGIVGGMVGLVVESGLSVLAVGFAVVAGGLEVVSVVTFDDSVLFGINVTGTVVTDEEAVVVTGVVVGEDFGVSGMAVVESVTLLLGKT